jgi:ammonia channel protein AmtB
MISFASLRPYLLAFGTNLLLFLLAWLGFNHGKGLFFFTTDELGLMLLLLLAVVINAVLWMVTLRVKNRLLRKAFGLLFLQLLGSCPAV